MRAAIAKRTMRASVRYAIAARTLLTVRRRVREFVEPRQELDQEPLSSPMSWSGVQMTKQMEPGETLNYHVSAT